MVRGAAINNKKVIFQKNRTIFQNVTSWYTDSEAIGKVLKKLTTAFFIKVE
jgi:hypothetical protein